MTRPRAADDFPIIRAWSCAASAPHPVPLTTLQSSEGAWRSWAASAPEPWLKRGAVR